METKSDGGQLEGQTDKQTGQNQYVSPVLGET